jgi:hypothetical protein
MSSDGISNWRDKTARAVRSVTQQAPYHPLGLRWVPSSSFVLRNNIHPTSASLLGLLPNRLVLAFA